MLIKWLPQEPIFFDFFEQYIEITPVKKLEHQADQIVGQCIDKLHKSFITPFQQSDIFRLISCMDDIIDCIDKFCESCLIYKIFFFPF